MLRFRIIGKILFCTLFNPTINWKYQIRIIMLRYRFNWNQTHTRVAFSTLTEREEHIYYFQLVQRIIRILSSWCLSAFFIKTLRYQFNLRNKKEFEFYLLQMHLLSPHSKIFYFIQNLFHFFFSKFLVFFWKICCKLPMIFIDTNIIWYFFSNSQYFSSF